VVEINARSHRRSTPLAYDPFCFLIVNEEIDELVWSERPDHLEVDLLHAGYSIGPGFGILGPG
jgi:hypothetical protein